MKAALNMAKKNPLVLIAILAIAIALMARYGRSGYKMSPREIQIEGEQPNLFDTPYSAECVPGPQATAGAYTKSLTPGGFCGLQQKVAQAAGYKIAGGIGGDLV
tara:strand:- start:83 stop:394 length:312 start_codon:yes stop_codon:yes gene_type:complete